MFLKPFSIQLLCGGIVFNMIKTIFEIVGGTILFAILIFAWFTHWALGLMASTIISFILLIYDS